MNNPFNHQLKLIILFLFIAVAQSCDYEFVEIDEPDMDVKVNFSEDILPMFASHKCTACHQSNYTKIDFTDENAYNTIVPNLLDTVSPELSRIYIYPNPASTKHQFKKFTPTEAATVLNWIIQGAENN